MEKWKKMSLLWIVTVMMLMLMPANVFAEETEYATVYLELADGTDLLNASCQHLKEVLQSDGNGGYLCEVGTKLEFTITVAEGYDLIYYCYGLEGEFGGSDIPWDTDNECHYVDIEKAGTYTISTYSQMEDSWEQKLLRKAGMSAGTRYFAEDETPKENVIYNFTKMNLKDYINDDWYYELTYAEYMAVVDKYFVNYCEMKDYLIKLGEYDEENDKVLIYSGGAGGGVDWVLTSTYNVSDTQYVLQGIYVSDSYTSGVPYGEYEYIVHPVELTLSSAIDGEWEIVSYEMGTYYCIDDEQLGATIYTYDENGISTGKTYYRITTMYNSVGDEELMPIDLSNTVSFKYDQPYEHWYLGDASGEEANSWSVAAEDGYTIKMLNWLSDGSKTYQYGTSGTFEGKGTVMLIPEMQALFTVSASNASVSVKQGLTALSGGTYAYSQGTAVELTITPSSGYAISSVKVGDVNATYVSASGTYVAYPSFAPGKITVTTKKNCDQGHSWNSGTVTKAATCTTTGTKKFTCTVCSNTKTETIAKKAHSWKSSYTIDKVATCTATGSKSIRCSVCNTKKSGSDTVIAMKAHTYGSYDVVKKASFQLSGAKVAYCTVCNHENTVVIPKAKATLGTTKYHYTDSQKSPSVTVKTTSGTTLTKGTHYTYQYGNTDRMSIGTHSVKITLKGSQYSGTKTLYFYVLPKGPASAWGSLYEYNKVKVSWEKSYKAVGYYVYYKLADTSNEYQLLGTTTNTYYKTGALSAGKEYTFKIIPYINGKDGKVSWEKTVANTNLRKCAICDVQLLKKVSTPTVTKVDADTVKVSWAEIVGENGYEISRADTSSGTKNKKTTTNNYIKIDPSRNKTWYYKVRAYRGSGDNRVYTPWSTVTSYNLRYVSEVRNVKANLSGAYNQVKVTWTKSAEGANKYYVYKKKGSGSYSLAGSTSGTSYTVSGLDGGGNYTFKVVPAYVSNGKIVLKGTAKTASVYTLKKMAAPTFERTSSTKVKVKWSKVNGASGYQISKYYIDKGTSVVATVYSGSTTSKTIEAKKGLTAFLKVRPYKTVNGTKIYGPWSNATEIHYSK